MSPSMNAGNDAVLEEENAAYDLPEPFSLPEFEESNPFSTQSLAASAQRGCSRRSHPRRSLDENLDEDYDENEVRPLVNCDGKAAGCDCLEFRGAGSGVSGIAVRDPHSDAL